MRGFADESISRYIAKVSVFLHNNTSNEDPDKKMTDRKNVEILDAALSFAKSASGISKLHS